MNNIVLTILVAILIIALGIVIYRLDKQDYRIKILEYNNNSLMEILLLLQNGAVIEKIDTGDKEQ